MEISRYLAMTKGEMAHFSCPAGYFPGWMACHFSPYGTGLSNFPRQLPPESMLILNDRTPICGHDPVLVRQQLQDAVHSFGCSCVLLDFQRPDVPETAALCALLAEGMPCPVGVSEFYAADTKGPVFLSPVPVDVPPEAHLEPWQNREIWLETAPEVLEITVTESGSSRQFLPTVPEETEIFFEEKLHCHYQTEVLPNAARFTLWRDQNSLDILAKTVASLGVTKTVGLYQDFKGRPGVI